MGKPWETLYFSPIFHSFITKRLIPGPSAGRVTEVPVVRERAVAADVEERPKY
jgi:hypothetical protein